MTLSHATQKKMQRPGKIDTHHLPLASSLIPAVNKLGTLPLMLSADDTLLKTYLPAVASGEAMFSYCLSEREAGSDAAAMKTRAVRDGDAYVLNGQKSWISNAGASTYYTVMAVTDPERGPHGISAFVVDANTVRRIARLAEVGPGDHVVEVGAGLGSLTLALAETGAEVLAVEDSQTGITSALTAGLRCAALGFEASKGHYGISDLRQVVQIVGN